MPDNNANARKALGAVIEVRGRETDSGAASSRQHLLLGSLTKRPN